MGAAGFLLHLCFATRKSLNKLAPLKPSKMLTSAHVNSRNRATAPVQLWADPRTSYDPPSGDVHFSDD
jgi:hypothetical protein